MAVSPGASAIFVSLALTGLLAGILAWDRQGQGPTGLAMTHPQADLPVFPKYCHGWEQGVVACFSSKGRLEQFRCRKYYWTPSRSRLAKCCMNYFDCQSSGTFAFSSYCDLKTHLCRFN